MTQPTSKPPQARRAPDERGRSSVQRRIAYAFRLATTRSEPGRGRRVEPGLRSRPAKYRHDQSAALKLLAVGESPRDPHLDTAELAAWTNVAGVILNLDEVLNKN